MSVSSNTIFLSSYCCAASDSKYCKNVPSIWRRAVDPRGYFSLTVRWILMAAFWRAKGTIPSFWMSIWPRSTEKAMSKTSLIPKLYLKRPQRRAGQLNCLSAIGTPSNEASGKLNPAAIINSLLFGLLVLISRVPWLVGSTWITMKSGLLGAASSTGTTGLGVWAFVAASGNVYEKVAETISPITMFTLEVSSSRPTVMNWFFFPILVANPMRAAKSLIATWIGISFLSYRISVVFLTVFKPVSFEYASSDRTADSTWQIWPSIITVENVIGLEIPAEAKQCNGVSPSLRSDVQKFASIIGRAISKLIFTSKSDIISLGQ